MLELDVFLEGQGEPVGRLTRNAQGGLAFRYLRDDLLHPISQSLPIREASYDDVAARGFFDNLLFENAQRDQVMQRHGLAYSDTVGLLYHLGRDCPGSISVVPKGEGPVKQPGDLTTDYEALSGDDLEALMLSLRNRRRVVDGMADPSPLAGVQGKVALVQFPNGGFGLPRRAGAPTTHILKVPGRGEMRLVGQEHLAMQIAADLLTHPVAQTEEVGQGDLRGLLITRFDREVTGTTVRRIHQEDFCQALGLGPDLKYERNGVEPRAFNAQRIGDVLAACARPGPARQAFLEGTLVNMLLGNTDNHAKNHALLYHGAQPQLAPFYDIVPTLLDDQVTHALSFNVGAAEMTDELTPSDLERFADALGFRRITPAQRRHLVELVQRALAWVAELNGPRRKRQGDVIAEQVQWLAPALGAELDIPERDLVVINRP